MSDAVRSIGDVANPDACGTIADILDQVVTMRVDEVTYEPTSPDGWIARIRVAGGLHEIVCELGGDGRLLSARILEL